VESTINVKKGKLSLCLINQALHHEDIWGSSGIAPPFWILALLGGPQSWSGRCGEEKNLAPLGMEPSPTSPCLSLYQLSYPDSGEHNKKNINTEQKLLLTTCTQNMHLLLYNTNLKFNFTNVHYQITQTYQGSQSSNHRTTHKWLSLYIVVAFLNA
jgi:hypothetical protein